jgi:two-component system sensor histidine kinase and response regulator WspE
MSQISGGLGDFSMFELFRLEVESQSLLLNKNLLDLEEDVASESLLESLMRASHSLKGAARMVGVDAVVKISHVMEDCFVSAQKNEITITKAHIDHLLKSVDLIDVISKVDEELQKQWYADNVQEVDSIVEDYSNLSIEGNNLASESKSTKSSKSTRETSKTNHNKSTLKNERSDESNVKSTLAGTSEDRTLRIDADRMSRILGMTSELLVETRDVSKFSDTLNLLKRRQDELMNLLGRWRDHVEVSSGSTGSEYEQESIKRLDECRGMLIDHLSSLDHYDRRTTNLTKKLYNEVAGSRMRPFSDGLVGFKRMVRDLARDLNKEVSLKINGLDTPVDRDVLEKIKAPLNHLLRNAVDHGVEAMEIRAEGNKPQQASVSLSATHGAGMLRITVKDDGGGINIDGLRKKLIDKGLVDKKMIKSLGEPELLEFLFLPDFSTRDEVTEISGRGVGLDVVRDMVRELGGTVAVDTTLGKGTKFTLQLPLTLSVISALLVNIAGEPYAFPLVRVDRILRVPAKDIEVIEGRQFVRYGLDNIGLVSCAQILGFDVPSIESEELTIVVISDRLDRYGVVVDQFIGQRQLSVQALDTRLGKVPDVSSTALMEDGSPLFVLDIDDLVRSIDHIVRGGRLGNVYQAAQEKIQLNRKQVLVIDDSLTIREVERDLLESRGYHVDVAVDGMDGWNAVRTSHYDLVITDIDMPRMDGIELVYAIKQDLHLKSTPVMIVSYKDRQEDRQRGLEAGADYYLTKGSFQDETLIEAVIDLIGEVNE